ncbi:S26 family signal peptidase, partial [Salmonella enterica]|nr:S26 family signal peptidase [Salmonella enterica]EGZ2498397.1 S26 family signal peptidase [Escherichia coli]EBE7258861.1 S26 family signal peptidase [Salmonella enterica]EGZ2620356.1 S26 family signal peptidase [Escherichia coli]EGZ7392435.1 S26 family signal peptidase [Escherichia coli]
MNFPLKKYFVKKESWKRFGVKAGVTLVVLWAAGAAFASRYRIGIDPQQEKCLPGYT